MTNEDTASHCLPRKILEAELTAVGNRRRAVGLSSQRLADRLVGLALSGGGIRSACFSLGVMQRLAQANVLKYFDYLSTVSGGGYIGGSLTWLLSHSTRFNTISEFPYGVCHRRLGRSESKILTHLRNHGKYLTPGRGITATSLVAVVLRGIILNLLVWLPLAALSFRVLQFLVEHIGAHTAAYGYLMTIVVAGTAAIAASILYSLATRSPAGPAHMWLRRFDKYLVRPLLWVGFALTGLALLSLVSWHPVALAGVGAAFLLVSAFYSLATWRPPPQAYRCRRRFEKHVRPLLWVGLGLAGFVSLRLLSDGHELDLQGVMTLLVGITGGLGSFAGSGPATRSKKLPVGVLAPVAAVLVLYGLALVAYELAEVHLRSDAPWATWLFAGAVVLSLVTGCRVNLNYISIHRYYRDRLMEAFMPRPNTNGRTGAAAAADGAKLQDMCVPQAPYQLVNTNVVLVDSDDPRWRQRGGDAFLLSPRYCGSTATGWQPTADYMQWDALTLPTAIAISGAAANPNTAAGGAGPTRRPMLSLLMGLLNIRLGYWAPRPNAQQRIANHFRAAWYELHPRGYAEDRQLLQLSDGGHFENLGVYELVRRRVKVIVCCDAAADPGFAFRDLQVLMRRIGSDFGAEIKFDGANRLEHLIPRPPAGREARRLPGQHRLRRARLCEGGNHLPGREQKYADLAENNNDPRLGAFAARV